ncbi:MAG: DUF4111 domain-containing protein [Methylorubrum populi]
MSRRPPLRVDVARTVDRFLGLMRSEGAPALRGLYLVGSVALGDFRPGRSDIDFVALLDAAPSEEATQTLARVHAALARAGGPHFDGLYLPIDALRQPPEPGANLPFSVDGQLRIGEPCREANPAVWRCLARSSRPILGATPAALNIADDDARLRAYGLADLEEVWRPWIARCEAALARKAPDERCDAAALERGVLGIARILCTLATGRIVSKTEGGRRATALLPQAHHAAVEDALAARFGDVEPVPQATMRAGLDAMRFLIDAAPGYQTGPEPPTSPDR